MSPPAARSLWTVMPLPAKVTRRLTEEPLLTIAREEVTAIPPEDWESVIIATGPLTAPALSEAIGNLTGEDSLAFFDAIAPVIHRDSIDFSKAWFQSRYDKGDGADYINCPLDEVQYEAFIDALQTGDATEFKGMGKGYSVFRRLPAD